MLGRISAAAMKALKKKGTKKNTGSNSYEREIRRLHKKEKSLKGQSLIKNKKQQLNLMNKQMKSLEGSKSAGSVTKKLAGKKAGDAAKLGRASKSSKPIVKKLIGGIIGSGAKMAAKRAQARVRAEVARKKREARKKMLEKKAKTEAQNIATNKRTRNTRRRGRIAVARQRQERKKSEEGITKPQTGTVLDKTNLIKAGEEAKKPSPILTGRGRAKTTGDKDK